MPRRMTPDEINSALALNGSNQAKVAKSVNVHHTLVWQVVYNIRKSRKVRAALAKASRMSYEAMWGEKDPLGQT